MEIRVKNDSVEVEGYVNAIERTSKPLMSRAGRFIERICKGAFRKALNRNDDIHILLNHDWNRDLGSTKEGNLKLTEDNIGLRATATITDPDVVKKARAGDLVGWSFGFTDRDVAESKEKGLPLREVRDLDLYEVSILDRSKTPAYDGTLIMARDDNSKEINVRNELIDDDLLEHDEHDLDHDENIVENNKLDIIASKIAEKVAEILNKQTRDDEVQEIPKEDTSKNEPKADERPKQQDVVENIDYSQYENMIKEMKEEI